MKALVAKIRPYLVDSWKDVWDFSMDLEEPIELLITLVALLVLFAGMTAVPHFLGAHWYAYALTGVAVVLCFVVMKVADRIKS